MEANVLPTLTDLRSRADVAENYAKPIASTIEPLDPLVPWYAAQTNPRSEVAAMHGIAALGWRTYLPFGWRWARPRHAPSDMHVMRRRPGMPGYLFIIAPADERGDIRITEARSVDGVKCVVSQAGKPLRIRPQAIGLLMKAEQAGVYDFNSEPSRNLKDAFDLAAGQKIRITAGVGEGWIATVVRRSNAKEVEVRDDVFGAKLSVGLDRLIPLDIES